MNACLAVLLFPVIFFSMYFYRLILFDLLHTLFDALSNLILGVIGIFTNPKVALSCILSFLGLIITLPFLLILEIPIALVVSFVLAVQVCSGILHGELTVADAIKQCFRQKRTEHT